MKLGLIPLRNFAIVDNNLYRCAQPEYSYEYKFLKEKLGIKTVVNLRGELNHDDKFAEQNGFKVINFDIPDHHCPTIEQAKEFVKFVKNNKEPLLFHCEHGRGRTSSFCVLARLAMGWTLERALKEEKEEYGYNFQHPKQLEFLKDFYKNHI